MKCLIGNKNFGYDKSKFALTKYQKLTFPLSSGVWTSAFARQSASFALATTHSQDVLFNASRPYRRSNLPLTHEVRFTKQIIWRNCGLNFMLV